MAGYQPATSFMAMPKLAEATFYGVSVLDGCLLSMLPLSTRGPRLQLCRAPILFQWALTLLPTVRLLFAFLPSTLSRREKSREATRLKNQSRFTRLRNCAVRSIKVSTIVLNTKKERVRDTIDPRYPIYTEDLYYISKLPYFNQSLILNRERGSSKLSRGKKVKERSEKEAFTERITLT